MGEALSQVDRGPQSPGPDRGSTPHLCAALELRLTHHCASVSCFANTSTWHARPLIGSNRPGGGCTAAWEQARGGFLPPLSYFIGFLAKTVRSQL